MSTTEMSFKIERRRELRTWKTIAAETIEDLWRVARPCLPLLLWGAAPLAVLWMSARALGAL